MDRGGEDANETWRVKDDAAYVYKDGAKYGPGDRFRPTRRQVANQTLTHKAEKVTEHSPPSQHTGADIGLRALTWGSDAALKLAISEGVDADELATREPSGATGYVKADVEALL